MASRRSSRAVPRKSYAHEDLINDPDVYDDPLDREASPDQSSELSAPPSVASLSDVESDLSEAVSEASVETEKPVKAKKVSKPKASPAKPALKKESTKSTQTLQTGTAAMKAEEDDEAMEEDEDDETGEVKQTKAAKFRERDARLAEKYAEFEPRPPTIDSDYVPVPFKGRLGYACLNTILRSRKEPVFCSRTTRIATIAKEDKGMAFVKELGKQNAADLSKMLEWNEKYGIRFFRLSSEMFPFASHPDYLYNLEHADEELRAAGAVANKYDHRVTCHPGQFTQIASPTVKIFDNAVRDLEFHNELLTRMRLQPEQRDRDAVLILHLGGAYGDKEATLERFRTNYARLSPEVKRRLVLENDDMSWSVTDLLPLCQELNIPLVLDWHHHNIVRDESRFREGSLDILPLLPAIAETWSRKGIKQKMHISEARLPNHPLPSKRRSHSARVYHLPPCADDMDIMIEAKDKEQAVFELAKAYNLNNPPLPPEVVGDGPGAKGDEAYWPEGEELRLKVTKTRVKKEPEYDSEGNEIKPTPKKRAKKEPEYDSEGNEIKAAPRKRVKKEAEYDSEGNEIKATPKKRAQKAVKMEEDAVGAQPTPKGSKKKKDDLVKTEAIETKLDNGAESIETKPALKRGAKARKASAPVVKAEDLPEEADDDKPAAKPKRGRVTKQKNEAQAVSVEKENEEAQAPNSAPKPKRVRSVKKKPEVKLEEASESAVDPAAPAVPPLQRRRSTRTSNQGVAASQTELETGVSARALVDAAVDRLEAARHQPAAR